MEQWRLEILVCTDINRHMPPIIHSYIFYYHTSYSRFIHNILMPADIKKSTRNDFTSVEVISSNVYPMPQSQLYHFWTNVFVEIHYCSYIRCLVECVIYTCLWLTLHSFSAKTLCLPTRTVVSRLSSPWLSEHLVIQTVLSQIPQSKYL